MKVVLKIFVASVIIWFVFGTPFIQENIDNEYENYKIMKGRGDEMNVSPGYEFFMKVEEIKENLNLK